MFRILRSVRLVIAVLVLGALGIGAGVNYMFGDGDITIVAPYESAVKVAVDGKPLGQVAAGGHDKFHLNQGKHDIELTPESGEATKWSINVNNGSYNQLLPVGGQCFGVFDVTEFAYGTGAAPKDSIRVTDRFTSKQPVDMPGSIYFSMKSLPEKIKDNETTKVLYEMPCDELKGDEKSVISAAGLDE